MDEVPASTNLGLGEFVQEVEEIRLSGKQASRDIPDLRKLSCRWSVDDNVVAVDTTLSAQKRLARMVAIYLCHRHSGAKFREIGERFGIGESAVSQENRRLFVKMAVDEGLRVRLEKVFPLTLSTAKPHST